MENVLFRKNMVQEVPQAAGTADRETGYIDMRGSQASDNIVPQQPQSSSSSSGLQQAPTSISVDGDEDTI